MTKKAIVWIREDLRIDKNPTLSYASQNHDFVIDNVIQVLNNKDKIKTNALEGLKVVEIIERIYKSFKN